jgi:hypothetical protein
MELRSLDEDDLRKEWQAVWDKGANKRRVSGIDRNDAG